MKEINFDAADSDVFVAAERIASDEFYNLVDMDNPIFFYGKVINDDPFNESDIDEEKTYCLCPHCDKLFELKGKPENGKRMKCPECEGDGTLADFRDKSLQLNEECEQDIAYMEAYEDGFVLRLFKAYADYSYRDYDDYTRLGWCPEMRFFEYGREYYHDGELKYFLNPTEDYDETEFVETSYLDDDSFWLFNYDDAVSDSPYLGDLKDNPGDEPLMYYLTKSFKVKAFRTLMKYGFKRLAESMIFKADVFPDSTKISEVLGVDYNQILAAVGEDISITELLAARQIYALNLRPTLQNINLLLDMERLDSLKKFKLTKENARKVFKYLRNQQNRKGSENIGKDYVDYLSECEELDFDMTDGRILYPTDLLKAHVHTASLIKIKTDAKTELGVKKAYANYNKLCEYDNGKLCVIMPTCSEDIIYEGKVQSHCVGNYVKRVAQGEDIILFVRRSNEKDKPFYTMEIRPTMKRLDIVQCRGFENEDASPEIRAEVDAFLAEYASWFNSRKSNIEAEKTKLIYYKAVKKINGKYISAWDNKTEYVIGQTLETETDRNPDRVAVKGIHVASLEFAQKYGDAWSDVAILELEVDILDMVVPDAKDQLRASKVKVLREVPFSEMGDWGARHSKKNKDLQAA